MEHFSGFVEPSVDDNTNPADLQVFKKLERVFSS